LQETPFWRFYTEGSLFQKFITMKDNHNKIKVFLVDDDAVFLKMSEIELLEQADFDIETFATGELCLKNLSRNPDLIVLDYDLNGIDKNAMNGIQTLDKIKRFNSDINVVMMSSQHEIEIAVNCMQHRAFDYIVKDKTAYMRLKNVISNMFQYKKMDKELVWYV
jgi:two-component system, OmpR family, response regulator